MREIKPPDAKKRKTKPPEENQQYVSPGQAALLTGLSVRTIYKYCQEGADPQIPHKYGPGGKILISRDDLFRWLDLFKARPRRRRKPDA